ncbi:MAG TPA: cofactor-independent phosphoglycerate mutase [Dehalococcoidales bacterium]|nr:cofactor-independent phosphoglycerate mutase [Dehalococcoidales bacterium]
MLIMDGAAGLPLAEQGNRTSLEIARTPNLDALATAGMVGLSHNVPAGLEPDSAVACMSIFGYDPAVYYAGRAPIEAVSLDIPINPGEVIFRCNLVTVQDGKMVSHSAGSISTEESREIIKTLNEKLGNENIIFYAGVNYRNILKLKNAADTALAVCTPPHDIPGKPVAEFLPKGKGSDLLLDLMKKSELVIKDHPVNKKRLAEGKLPATGIWLFWGSGKINKMPQFRENYKADAAVTSAVGLLQGLGKMSGMSLLHINGVTDGPDNDYAGQVQGALDALKRYDVIIVHVEAPDEAGHAGSLKTKVGAIENIDKFMVSAMRKWRGQKRILVTPDHPTPVTSRTHNSDPVPFLLWGPGITGNGAKRLTEKEAKRTGLEIAEGHTIMRKLLGDK